MIGWSSLVNGLLRAPLVLITARTGTEENLKLGSPQQGKTPRGWAGEQ